MCKYCEEEFNGKDYNDVSSNHIPARLFIMPNGDTYLDYCDNEQGWGIVMDRWDDSRGWMFEKWLGYFKTKKELVEYNEGNGMEWHRFEHFNYCPYCGRKF